MRHYFDKLSDAARKNWDKPALSNWRGVDYTFKELVESIEKAHIFFRNSGISKGDKISLYGANSAQWAVSFLSVNTFGAVAVPLLSDFMPDNVATLINHAESKILFTDREKWVKMDIEKMPEVKAVILMDDFSLAFAAEDGFKESFNDVDDEFFSRFPNGMSPADCSYPTDNLKDLSVINYTSGTTSAPKGVMIRYECFCASIDYAIRNISCSEKDTMLSMLPMGHIYGLVFEFLYPLCHGVHVYFLGKTPAASTLLKAMKDVKPYQMITVPLVMEKIYRNSIKPALEKPMVRFMLRLPFISNMVYKKVVSRLIEALGGNIQQFILGGAALNGEVEKIFHKMRLPYLVGYGMTEAAPLLAYADWRIFRQGSCGKVVDMDDIRIDSPAPDRIPGEIQAKGPNICSGYFKNPEATRDAFTDDGYLRTGDLGVMDAQGNLFIRGRSKNMILSANGQNIFPEEIESIICAQDYVSEAIVVDRDFKLVALVYLDPDALRRDGLDKPAVEALAESIQKATNSKLPSYSQITKVELQDSPFVKTPKLSIKRFLYK